jgi:hypothetical protein
MSSSGKSSTFTLRDAVMSPTAPTCRVARFPSGPGFGAGFTNSSRRPARSRQQLPVSSSSTGSACPTNQIFPATRPRTRLSISPRTTCSSMRQAMWRSVRPKRPRASRLFFTAPTQQRRPQKTRTPERRDRRSLRAIRVFRGPESSSSLSGSGTFAPPATLTANDATRPTSPPAAPRWRASSRRGRRPGGFPTGRSRRRGASR